MDGSVLALEEDAFSAWPAAEVEAFHGWRLRANHGVTNRANSVWPNQWHEGPPLAARIAAVESFYRERHRPAIFQLTTAARPVELDAALDSRGYEAYSPVSVQTAAPEQVARECARSEPAARVHCAPRVEEPWFAFSGPAGRFGGAAAPVYRELLGRIEAPCCFATAESPDGIVAVGLGVEGNAGTGVFSMRTQESQRGRGHGRSVLGAIARWAAERGAPLLYLQVEEDNAPARRLYDAAGFIPRYGYHYRRRTT